MTSIDDIDLDIIEALRQDPRVTNKEIASQLGIAESTVAQRIRNLAERDAMRVVAQKHIFTDGYQSSCFLFINTNGRTVQRICADIDKLSEVFSISQGMGNPDIFVHARIKALADANTLASQIGSITGVTTVEVTPCFVIHKFDAESGDLSVGTVKPEESDDSLFHALHKDGRQSNREIARQLNVSEGAVRQRIKKKLQSGEMRFQVVCNPLTDGLNVGALLRIATLRRHTEKIVDNLVRLESSRFVGQVAGTSNILAMLTATDLQSLADACDNIVLPMRGVQELDVQLLVSHYKHQYHLGYFDRQMDIPRRK